MDKLIGACSVPLARGRDGNRTARGDAAASRHALYLALAAVLASTTPWPTAAQTEAARQGRPAAPAGSAQPAAATSAGVAVNAGVSVGQTWDSNVFATLNDARSDVLTAVAPFLTVRDRGVAGNLALEAGGEAVRYRTYGHEDSNDYHVDLSGSLYTGDQGNVFGGAGYSRRHEDRTSPDGVFGTRPTVYGDAHAHAGVSQRWGGFSLNAGGTFNRLRFGDVSSATGAPIDNHDRDRDVLGAGARLGYALFSNAEVFVQGTLDRRSYVRRIDDYGFRRDSHGSGWAVGLARSRGLLRGEIYVGRLDQHYDDPALPDVSIPVAGARVDWNASARTTVSAYLQRSIEETTLSGASAYVDTLAGLGVDRRLGERLSAKAGISLTRTDFRGIVRRDDLAEASMGLSYRLARHLYLDADYRLQRRRSDVPDAEYVRNQIYLGLRVDSTAAPAGSVASTSAPEDDGRRPAGGFYIGTGIGYEVLDTHVSGLRGGDNPQEQGESKGTDEGDFAGSGATGSIFAGYGVPVARVYVGIEAEASRSRADWLHEKTPDSRIYSTRRYDGYGAELRLGYVLPGDALLYAAAGRVRARFDSVYLPDGSTRFAQKDTRDGTRYGVGLDLPLSAHGFVRARYDITRYAGYGVDYGDGEDGFADNSGRFLLGLGWRLGGAATPAAGHGRGSVDGFYVGAQGGDNRFDSRMDATHRQPGPPAVTRFDAYFGSRGNLFGAFAGYGHAFGPLYAGIEADADAGGAGWFHAKDPGGRDYSVEDKSGFGASLRLGYATRGGALVYVYGGRVRSRLRTQYVKGHNTSTWIDREGTRGGTRFGLGAEAPLTPSTFVRLDYSTTRYASMAFSTTQEQVDEVRLLHRQQLFRIGLGMRF